MDYQEFLKTKERKCMPSGFETGEVHEFLFPFQRDIVKWALKRGKSAIFADCGLGKSPMQLSWSDIISKKENGNIIIIAPLCVSKQTIREGKKFNIEVNSYRENGLKKGINIINYENIDHINPDDYIGVVLDESSILKAYTGKTKKKITNMFKNTKYKLCCTATPSPNDHMELLNHSEFLGIMRSNEALSCWFILDTMNTGKYRIKKHAEKDFWKWVSSWAVSIEKPSDLGYEDGNFKLPNKVEHTIEVKELDIEPDEGMLFYIPEVNATNYHKIRKNTVKYKLEKITDILESKKEKQFVIWVDTNHEADVLKSNIKESVEIRGNDSIEKKEQAAMDFIDGKIRILISKSSIFGFGMNFQNCYNTILCGISYSYENYYQLIRRFWRFGQTHEVNIYKILSIYENEIYNIVNEKMLRHEEMKEKMKFFKEYFNINNKREFHMEYNKQEFESERFKIINGDSIQEIKTIDSDSVDFQIFSPPFSQLYIYSDSFRDMGNTADDVEFFTQFNFLIPELYRILKSGRLCAVHCKQLVNYINRDGASGIRDFRGDIIRAFQNHGFIFHTEITIWKDPVIEMQRTKSHGLLYKQLRKDSTYSRVGLPDYIVVFRKWTDAGDVDPVNTKTHENFKLNKWQEYASPIYTTKDDDFGKELRDQYDLWERDLMQRAWFNIQQTNVLNKQMARDNEDEKHICPLQLDVIEKCVELWTNPEDVVFTPFAGIGSEIYQSLLLNRRGLGIELKESYYNESIKYCLQAEELLKQNEISLFD